MVETNKTNEPQHLWYMQVIGKKKKKALKNRLPTLDQWRKCLDIAQDMTEELSM